jgi:D-specific alpha-keto acid dehydrogenase
MSIHTPPTAMATREITVFGCGQDEAGLFRQIAPRLGVLPTVTDAALSETTIGLAFGNRCISVGHKTRVSNTALRALGRMGVEYISTRSIGYDHIDLEYAGNVGIAVENVAYSPDSVADYTVMLILMALRGAKCVIRRADAHDYRLSDAPGRELRDLTVGVVGTGRIGTAVIDRLHGFGCRVLAHDTRATAVVDQVPLDELLRCSGVVTLHIPLTATSHHLLDAQRIARMKPGAIVVNTGRGALVDTDALLSALEYGGLGGAALDVVEGEEGVFYTDCRKTTVTSESMRRLQEMPNVIISPHTAYYTDHALADMVENSLVNCVRFERDRRRG